MLTAFCTLYSSKSQCMETNIGQKFGRLTIVEIVKEGSKEKAISICECGRTSKTNLSNLLTGNTKSCGCYRDTFKKTHGHSKHKLHYVRMAMISRCYNPKNLRYKNYGDRGIAVCSDWLNSYESFLDWAFSNGYKEGLTLERKEVDGNYEPSNCRWATTAEQGANTTSNQFYTVDGVTKHLNSWARFYGLTASSIKKRMRVNNCSFVMALYTRDESAVRYKPVDPEADKPKTE